MAPPMGVDNLSNENAGRPDTKFMEREVKPGELDLLNALVKDWEG